MTPATPTAGQELDRLDLQLLRLLQAEGRITNARLAEAVGLSATAVQARLRRLVADAYILGYETVLNPALLGGALLLFAEVRLAGSVKDAGRDFRAAVCERDEILECHEVAGSFDYLIKVRVPDFEAYLELLASAIWSLPGVRHVRTHPVIEEVKDTGRIPL